MAEVATENATTVKNLLSALEGESNANAKYNAFVTKAEADGFRGAASLFRAAARAEQIHATNHARVIVQLGAASISLHQAGPGLWDATVPFSGNTSQMTAQASGLLSAIRADGMTTSVTIPLTVVR